MEFEWDDLKALANLKKHGIPFVFAVQAFDDPHGLDFEDLRRDYREERRIVLSMISGQIYVVTYTPAENRFA